MGAELNAIGMILMFVFVVGVIWKWGAKQYGGVRKLAFLVAMFAGILVIDALTKRSDLTGLPMMQILIATLLIAALLFFTDSVGVLLRTVPVVVLWGLLLSLHFLYLVRGPEYAPKINAYGKTRIPPGAGWEWYSGITDLCPVGGPPPPLSGRVTTE